MIHPRTTSCDNPAKILIIVHQEHSTPGRIGRFLIEDGYQLDIRRPRFGDPLPSTMDGHAGAIIFGGPMSANDEDDYIKQETDWIGVPLKENKPFLGVCLGAQMLARHLGHKVYRHPAAKVEIGYYPLNPTPQGDAYCGQPLPRNVYQWHREGFELPRGGVLLARGDDFEVQACALENRALAIQFHPEVTYATMCRWTTLASERMGGPGAQPRPEHLSGWYQHDGAVARWLRPFLHKWAGRDLSPS